jgi:hypothetical protein
MIKRLGLVAAALIAGCASALAQVPSGPGATSFSQISGQASPSQLPAATSSAQGAVTLGASGGAAAYNDSRITGACQTTGCTFTGAITPSASLGIVGSSLGTMPAGAIGEQQNQTASAVSLTAATTANGTSKILTAGNWNVQCTAQFIPAGTTTVISYGVGVSTTSATFGTFDTYSFTNLASAETGLSETVSSPVVPEQFSSSTTVYCPVNSNFAVSTLTVSVTLRATRAS